MSSAPVAIITGGGSGFGLAVATRLAAKGWVVHVFDLNAAAGEEAERKADSIQFTRVDVTSWESLSSSFDLVFRAHGRLDFVFANAGALPLKNFYERVDTLPPPELPQISIDLNLKSVINTSYLAQHYFRANTDSSVKPVLIMTASIAGFYAQEFNPLYSAAKAGVVNFLRCVGRPYFQDGIRTYAICPGTARTNLTSKSILESWPEEHLTPISTVVSTVEMLIHGEAWTDANGKHVFKSNNYGLAVEVFGKHVYIRDQIEFINDGMKEVVEASSLGNQEPNLGEGKWWETA